MTVIRERTAAKTLCAFCTQMIQHWSSYFHYQTRSYKYDECRKENETSNTDLTSFIVVSFKRHVSVSRKYHNHRHTNQITALRGRDIEDPKRTKLKQTKCLFSSEYVQEIPKSQTAYQTHGTVRKSYRTFTVTRHPKDKKGKSTSSLFLVKLIEKLERT